MRKGKLVVIRRNKNVYHHVINYLKKIFGTCYQRQEL